MAVVFKKNGKEIGHLERVEGGAYEYAVEPGCEKPESKWRPGDVPNLKTDKRFFYAGRCSSDADERVNAWRSQQAEAAGVSTTGKVYCSGLARFPGDPEAWISDASDVRRVAEKNNYNVTGMVEYKARECEPIPSVDIADDILDRRVMERLAEDPESDRDQVREEEKALATGQVDPHPPLVTDHWFGQDH